VVIDVVVAKYCDYLPLYRQSVMLERDTGLAISRATLDGWVLRVGALLLPVAAVIGRELLSSSYLQADETPVAVQRHDRRGKNHQAYLWQYGRPGGSVVFDFQLGRGRDGPQRFLRDFHGLLQTDGYVAYEGVGGAGMVQAACWAHYLEREVIWSGLTNSLSLLNCCHEPLQINRTQSASRKASSFGERMRLERGCFVKPARFQNASSTFRFVCRLVVM